MTYDDSFRTDALGALMREGRPMATCPRDGEPLISTLEFRGAEFVCVACGVRYGFLAPKPAESTPELEARHEELRAEYERQRRERTP